GSLPAGPWPEISIGEQRLEIAFDEPMPGCPRAWFVCPKCEARCRHIYLAQVSCRRCAGLDWASRHRARSVPGFHRAMLLRRRIRPGPPLSPPPPPKPRHWVRFHRIAAEICALERRLLAHLRHDVNDVIERRRKRRGE